MPIMNYSTEIPSERTVGEITMMLIRKNARSITTDFDDAGELTAVRFVMLVGGLPIQFLLPANVDGVAAAMLRDEPWNSRRTGSEMQYKAKLKNRAKWVAWRILKDWIAAQMALIESNQAEAAQVFMPYAQQDDGKTMFQVFVEGNQRRLGAGSQ
jgi:hypothetical protein